MENKLYKIKINDKIKKEINQVLQETERVQRERERKEVELVEG